MTTRNLLNVVLALAVLLIGAWIWQSEKPLPTPEPERLTGLSADAIQRIAIHPARAPASVLERRDGEWQLIEPFTAPANAAKIKAVLDFARAPSLARYAVSTVDVQQLGLAPPDLLVRLNDVTLAVGGTEALQGWRYVQNGDTVHLIVDRYSYLLQAGPDAMVSPRLLPEGASVREIQLPGLHLRQGAAGWQRLDGEAASAKQSADALQMLVDEWRYAQALRVSRVSEDGADVSGERIRVRLQGDAPAIDFILQRADDEVRLIRVQQGLIYHFTPSAAERLRVLPKDAGIRSAVRGEPFGFTQESPAEP